MDRRQFVQALSVLAIPTVLPVSGIAPQSVNVAPFPKSASIVDHATTDISARIGVIAVGAAGGEIISKLGGNLPFLTHSIAIDTVPEALRHVLADQKILFKNDKLLGDGRAVEATMQIAEAVSSLDIVFLVGAIEGGTDAVISSVVTDVLKSKRIISIRAVIPLAAPEALACGGITNAAVPICAGFGAQSTVWGGFSLQEMDQAIRGFEYLYRGVISPVVKPGLVTADLDSIEEIITDVGLMALGYGQAIGANAAEQALAGAIDHPLLGIHRLRAASRVLVSIEGPARKLRFKEVNGILKGLQHAIGDVDHDQLITFGATYNETSEDAYQVTILAGGVLVSAEGYQ